MRGNLRPPRRRRSLSSALRIETASSPTLCATTELASTWPTRGGSSRRSSAFTRKLSFRGPGSDSLRCIGSWIGTAGACGPRAPSTKALPSSGPCPIQDPSVRHKGDHGEKTAWKPRALFKNPERDNIGHASDRDVLLAVEQVSHRRRLPDLCLI